MAPQKNPVTLTRLTPSTRNDDQFSVNIILIHGLSGHPRKTWEAAAGTRSSSKVFWPQDYLVSDIPQACVWLYAYNQDTAGGLFQAKNKSNVTQHGRDLAAALEHDIRNKKPFIFVAHSTGGIIVKDAIVRSDTVCDRTWQIVFLGTPHRGSGQSGWNKIAANLAAAESRGLNNVSQALQLEYGILEYIHSNFKEMVYGKGIKIHSFQEAQPITGVPGIHGKVVDDYSSVIDFPRALETVETLDADHFQMVKCSSRDDQVYRCIAGVLKQSMRKMHGH